MGLFDKLFGKKQKEEIEDIAGAVEENSQELSEQIEAILADENSEDVSSQALEEDTKEFVLDEKVEEVAEELETTVEETIEEELVDQPRFDESGNTAEIAVEDDSIVSSLEDEGPRSIFMEDTILEEVKEELELPEKDQEEVIQVAVTESVQEEPVAEEAVKTEEKYEKSLKKTSKTFGDRFNSLMANFRSVDEEFFEEVEEALILSDVGYELSLEISEELRQEARLKNAKKRDDVKNVIIEKLADTLDDNGLDHSLNLQEDGLSVFIFVGVNGVGKTTTIGKLANRYRKEGKKVLLAAADTFRAGATDQLVEWGRRSEVPVVTGHEGSDPASVVFDAVKKAKDEDFDILLIDTAGRLQNKDNLMKELEKIIRIIKRELPDAPHETLLAVDATTGQNATQQAKQFAEVAPLTGIILTKLDGSAKGGIVFAIESSLKIPVKLVGLGEKIEDLEDFSPENFVLGVFSSLV